MTPYYDHGGITIYHGDCREILPSLGRFDLLLTDPPYGIDHSQFAGKTDRIAGDTVEFDPSHLLLVAPLLVLFGADAYADKLPASYGWFVWDKNGGCGRASFGDGELAWSNGIGCTRILRHVWRGGGSRLREHVGVRTARPGPISLHPAQKPVALMSEILGFFPEAKTVVDPYMGSGPVAKACKDRGLKYVGIELVEKYCEIAAKRLAQEVLFA